MSIVMLMFGVLCMLSTNLMYDSVRNAKWSIIGHLWVIGGILYWLIEHSKEVIEPVRMW